MATTVTELAGLIDRFTERDGIHTTEMSELTLYRFSGPSEPVAVLYEPSLCLIAQGSKEVRLGDEMYRYDPAHTEPC